MFDVRCLMLMIDEKCNINFEEMNTNWYDIKGDFELNLSDLQDSNKFKSIEFFATMQCTGNKSLDFFKKNNINISTPFIGYISNAKWKGVRISDILKYCGFNYDINSNKNNGYKYVTFYGNDSDISTLHYAIRICNKYMR